MRELWTFSRVRWRRRVFVWVMLIVAIMLGGAFWGLTKIQLAGVNADQIRQLERQAQTLATDLSSYPAKPDVLPQGQQTYWHDYTQKRRLLITLKQQIAAREKGDAVADTKAHLQSLKLQRTLLKPIGKSATKAKFDNQIGIDQQLINTGQTRIQSQLSLAPLALVFRWWTVLMTPGGLLLLIFGLDWLWRDTFSTATKQWLGLQVADRRLLVLENLLSTALLVVLFVLASSLTLIILSWLFSQQEVVHCNYPLTLDLTLGQQLKSLVAYSITGVFGGIALVQISNVFDRSLGVQLVCLMAGSTLIGLLPIGTYLNPLNQTLSLVQKWSYPLNGWSWCVSLVGMGLLIIWSMRLSKHIHI